MTGQSINRLIVIGAVVILGAGLQAQQRGWTMNRKSDSSTARGGALVVRPQASIGGVANGVYCIPDVENGVGIHDIGALPAGLRVTVTVKSYVDRFNPAAAVIVATVGERASNNVKATTFYDNDSGGENDSKIEFVTPQAGNYILLVGDYTDANYGCYRYEVAVR